MIIVVPRAALRIDVEVVGRSVFYSFRSYSRNPWQDSVAADGGEKGGRDEGVTTGHNANQL